MLFNRVLSAWSTAAVAFARRPRASSSRASWWKPMLGLAHSILLPHCLLSNCQIHILVQLSDMKKSTNFRHEFLRENISLSARSGRMTPEKTRKNFSSLKEFLSFSPSSFPFFPPFSFSILPFSLL